MLYYDYSNLDQLLHKEGVTNFEPYILLQLGPPPLQLSESYIAAIKEAPFPILSFTLVPISGHPVRFPIWVLDYWRGIKHATGYQQSWKSVLEWLSEISGSQLMVEICDQVMAGLSCFPWNGGNCTVCGMTSLLADSHLSDFHINHTLAKISHHHCDHYGVEVSKCHVFLTVLDLGSIIKAYKNGIHSACASHKPKQLLEVENRIISGYVDSVAEILHLPNHWTSLVITFKPPKILYGDSLGSSILSNKASSLQQWICHMPDQSGHGIMESDISVYSLPTTIQKDAFSCGLIAPNAISHHYLPQTSPLLQPNPLSVAHCRLEFALDLLQDDAVS